ncbi:MAG: HNH endonuclease signature motif containing protein [Planctomycetota bacterium]|nr:HNH endonuclease signature motif containing protein [Planctomycetota bacterium]
MTPALREQVRQRAKDCCEYCQTPQSCTRLPHEADHIRAQKHKGPTTLTNLGWSCALCNNHKGSDASAFVPGTDELVRLFNPRVDEWHDHFAWNGPELGGKTKMALATIELLKINSENRVSLRRMLIEVGLFPPNFEG